MLKRREGEKKSQKGKKDKLPKVAPWNEISEIVNTDIYFNKGIVRQNNVLCINGQILFRILLMKTDTEFKKI